MTRNQPNRRDFIRSAAVGAAALTWGRAASGAEPRKKPNIVFLLADQWRAQATGYAGDPNARTPNLDRLAAQSVNLTNAVSCCPVCCPYRGSLMTGQYPLTHGVFMNDVHLSADATSIAEVCVAAGYDTGYIGKWHLDGHGRSSFIPRERRQGFDYWKVLECTHNYNNSAYFGDENVKLKWDGYDAIAQTRDAQAYIKRHAKGKPFCLFLSWGPPHAPYQTAPEKYRAMFDAADIVLRPNVPEKDKAQARKDLAGYYAHIAALDDCIADILRTLKETGIEDDTILVFTSDHGDMLHSHGRMKKQQPEDESIRVPFLIRYPALLRGKGRSIDMLFNTPDIMPTLLGLSGVEIPETVEGKDLSAVLRGSAKPDKDAALIMCPAPFGQWSRKRGGREYRGIRTRRYTYARDLNGPWLLYDNDRDPYQLNNLCNKPEHAALQKRLDEILTQKLEETNDKFLPASDYIKKWGYTVDKSGTVPYTN